MACTLAPVCALMAASATAQQPASRPSGFVVPATMPEELRPILSPEQKRQAAIALIDAFVKHVSSSPDFTPAARAAVVDGWASHRKDEEPQDFLFAGLSIISEPFKNALAAMDDQKYDDAVALLKPLADMKDPYLSINARGVLARCLVQQEKLEEAEAVLKPLAAEEKALIQRSFLETEVDFLLGFCQLSNLEYDKALATLESFDRQHPDAPDKFRLPARQMLQELRAREPGSLGEVSDLMVYAGRKLANGEPGTQVEIPQKHAVDLLSKLITAAEEREQQQKQQGGKGGGSGSQRGARQPNSPANRSMLPGGKSETGRLERSPNARPGDEWGRMRPEDREKILQSLRRTFPSQYRQLVEQYYKQLAKEK